MIPITTTAAYHPTCPELFSRPADLSVSFRYPPLWIDPLHRTDQWIRLNTSKAIDSSYRPGGSTTPLAKRAHMCALRCASLSRPLKTLPFFLVLFSSGQTSCFFYASFSVSDTRYGCCFGIRPQQPYVMYPVCTRARYDVCKHLPGGPPRMSFFIL